MYNTITVVGLNYICTVVMPHSLHIKHKPAVDNKQFWSTDQTVVRGLYRRCYGGPKKLIKYVL